LISTKHNPFFERKEVSFIIEKLSTPSINEARRSLAEIHNANVEKIYIIKMITLTGTHKTKGLAHVYDDEAKAVQIEPEHIIKRNQTSMQEEIKKID